ncbi:sialic acid-binding Ig-like lectin 6 [Tenrec ecaudatus]|uniref:sialic acid-binding Ig-like lectin 6 n=1 Tax=Tenrec ecaudatus TaxID=94439 RepID=UPI003F59CCF8
MLGTLLLLLLPPLLWRGTLTQIWRPQLEIQDSVILQEGLCVLVLCKISPPWPRYLSVPNLFWFRKEAPGKHNPPVATNQEGVKLRKGAQGRFLLLGEPWNNCSLIIRDANVADSGTYVFHIETYYRKHTFEDKLLSVKVTALSQLPSIQIPEILESGNPRNLFCTVAWACEQGTPPIFSWNSAALTSVGPRTHLSSVLTISPRPQDHSTNLTCQVTFPAVDVTITRTVQLNVSYAPRNMAITIFQGSSPALKTLENASSLTVLEGQYLRLHCVVDSNPPARLSWFRGFPSANTSPISTGYAELSQVVTGEGSVFTCEAQNHLGSQQVFLNVSIYWEPAHRLGLGAVGGAGVTALLGLCIFLVIRVKAQREKAVRTLEGVHDVNLDMPSGSYGHQHPFATNIASDRPAPAVADRLSTEEEALHYASINFDRLKRKDREETDYTEIRAPK